MVAFVSAANATVPTTRRLDYSSLSYRTARLHIRTVAESFQCLNHSIELPLQPDLHISACKDYLDDIQTNCPIGSKIAQPEEVSDTIHFFYDKSSIDDQQLTKALPRKI